MAFFNFNKSSNPVFNEKAFQKEIPKMDAAGYQTMTVRGAIDKTILLFLLMLVTVFISYSLPNPLFLIGGAIVGLILVVVASFKPVWAPYLAPGYALAEGFFVGTVSAMYASQFNGIVFHAVSLTISMLFLMLIIYRLKLIKVTEKFKAGVIMATGAVFIVYMISFVMSFFGMSLPFLHEGGIMGIGISVVVIGIAAMNLLLDFDTFEKGEAYGAPKYMEWFSAMGLLITLVWLYIEFLRLLSKLNRD
jgi:uncharacterized YccA/Bax inhibitor family protein